MSDLDDPFKPSDATVLRPRPGAGRRGAGDAPPLPRRPAQPTMVETVGPAPRDLAGPGLNPLVQAASSLLVLAGQLRGTVSAPDVAGLRRHAVDEIRRFEERALSAGMRKEVVLAARYALCAAIDEAVLSTPWGAQGEWAQQPLLVTFHKEAWGGEKFFEMLDRVSGDPARNVDLLELQYLCLAMGFAGKYQMGDRGHARLADVERDLYQKIRDQRGTAPTELSLRWRGLEDRRHRLIRYVPWWVVGAATLAILTVTYGVYWASLRSASAPVQRTLSEVGLEDFTAARPAPPAAGPTLKTLLAADEARGLLAVEEEGGLTRVTLTAADLFPSGSATVNEAYLETLRRVASALNRVPGRVLVIGHTDDQPLRSFRYRDNFELSRERAASVVRVLSAGMDNPGRLATDGAGSNKPRFRPESTPENRAKNRRVEIIHVRG